MLKTSFWLLLSIMYLSLAAQTSDESEVYHSHVEILVTGVPCTKITAGKVGDSLGKDGLSSSSWRLPLEVFLPPLRNKPCVEFSASAKEFTSVRVTAISESYGDVRAIPGQLTRIMNPTAGWIKVTNIAEATPGIPLADQCRDAISGNGKLGGYYPGASEIYDLVPVIHGELVDVYVNARDLHEQAPIAKRYKAFSAYLYFVFRDENQRQLTIKNVNKVYPAIKAGNLKYVVMSVGYSPYGLDPSIARPNGEAVNGPVLSVGSSWYIEPVRCTTSVLYRDLGRPAGTTEVIVYPSAGTDVPTHIGGEGGFYDNCVDCKRWSIFLGDLTPLRTIAGYHYLSINEQKTPFMMKVVNFVLETLNKTAPHSND